VSCCPGWHASSESAIELGQLAMDWKNLRLRRSKAKAVNVAILGARGVLPAVLATRFYAVIDSRTAIRSGVARRHRKPRLQRCHTPQ